MEHVKSSVIQMDDYYPFGLTFNSFQRENSTKNSYLLNGIEKQEEFGLEWDLAAFRGMTHRLLDGCKSTPRPLNWNLRT